MNELNINKVVENLQLVKEEFIRCKAELKVSERKDVVASELKDMLQTSTNFEMLRDKLDKYIKKLTLMDDIKNNDV